MLKRLKIFIAAEDVRFLFELAVLFFLLPALTSAQGLKINLDVKENKYSYAKPDFPNIGLSLAFKELPLLKNKIGFSRSIKIDYKDKLVGLNDKLSTYPVYRFFPLSLDSYINYTLGSQYQKNWREDLSLSLAQTQQGQRRSLFQFDIPVKFPSIVKKIIGEGGPSLKITGNRKISFAGKSQWKEGVATTATYKPSKWPSLNMEQTYSFKINGNIGSKISVDVDQNSESKTDLENRIHLKYVGEEDEILQSVEAGNTTLGVGSSLVGYSQTVRGLFGFKATAKVGKLGLTMITSQEKASTEKTEFKAGAESAKITIRDYNYVARRFYYLGRSHYLGYDTDDFQAGDSLIYFELYKSIPETGDSISITTPHGLACVDPNCENPADTTGCPGEREWLRFIKLDNEKDYLLYPQMTETKIDGVEYATLPYVELSYSLDEDEVLAYYGEIERKNQDNSKDTIYIGNRQWSTRSDVVDDTTYLLKLLKSKDPGPDKVTWEYEWRNVYYLGAKNIEEDGLKIDIYNHIGIGGEKSETDPNNYNGLRYLRIFGLDRYDKSGNQSPDGVIDYSINQLDLVKGLLIFPDRHPFATGRSYTDSFADTLNNDDKVPALYNTKYTNQSRTETSKYYISVETKSRRTEYSLGHMNIIENSEVVTLNGRTLAKGRDYNIDYETGQVSFLSQEVLDPTAELKIDYEYAPFIMAEKKSLYGLQANYVTEGGLNINGVAIYKSEKTTDERPRVGEEPKKNFVWGTDLSFSLAPSIMTKIADALPLFGTEEPSKLNFSLKVAQSIPNPNIKNKAYIDDFEGSLEYTDLGVNRGVWTLASLPPPRDSLNKWQRAWMIWYNPYEQVHITDIWPKFQVQEKDRLVNVLNLEFSPGKPHIPADTSFKPSEIDRSCNGIMRSFGPGSYDQTRTKFLEVWVKGNKGSLKIDLGDISEDINANGLLETEDSVVSGIRDGILSPGEDIGLDGMTDAQEQAYYDTNSADPSGDNWDYTVKNDYSHINGTQGNAKDPDRSYRPDTEDINSDGVLDKTNNYFEFTLDLQNYHSSPYFVDKTDYNGWRLYRIPLEDVPDSSKVGAPSWERIRYARLWLASPETTLVQIASIQLVGNRWQSAGVELMNESSSFAPVDTIQESFNIFVINTYENSDYEPPAGVAGVLDRNTGVREREQSLVLRYKDLKRGHSGMAYRIHRTENYTNYQKLKMFVHGNIADSCVTFFYRMGTDPKNYYEYYTKLYEGWDPRNEVNIDFSQITALKNYMLMNQPKDSTGYRDTTEGNYRVVGNPSLSSVVWFAMGVYSDTLKQDSSGVVSGEIWVDELRIVDVRKVPGWYYTGTVSTKFADLLSLDINFSRKDSEFRGLTESAGSGTNSTVLGLRSGISLEKFIPPSWGFSLPFSFNWSNSLDLPRLKSNSDIVLPKELRRSERTEVTTKSFVFSPRFVRETNNWLLKLTLKRLTLSENLFYTRTDSRSPTVPISRAESYGFGLKYDANPKINLTLSPFKGLKSVFLLKKLSSETISFLPNKLVFTSSIKGAKSFSQNNVGNITSDYTRDFKGWIESSMTPLKTVQLEYKFETSRDIRNDKDIKFSLLPKNAKLGIELNRGQNFSANYRPKWVGILDQSFSFSSFYKENADPKLYHGSRVVGNQAVRNANFTFYWQRVFGILKPKPIEKKEGKGINPLETVRGFVGNLSQNLSSLSINYRITKTSSKSGLLARPSLSYQFGFTHKTDVPLTTGTEARSDGLNTQKSLDLSSALRISTDINISSFRYSKAITLTLSSGQPNKNISRTFPDLNITWGSLEKIKLLKRFANSAYYSFGYRKKVDETRDGVQYKLNKRDISTSFSPLISLNMTLKNGVQTSWKWDKQTTESQNIAQQNTGISTSNSYSASATYSFSAPKGIKLPFLKKIKFHSNLALGLDISIKRDQSKSSVSGNKLVVTGDSKSFSVVPRASYSFSSQVRGGLSGRWIDTKNNITGEKNHTRELSIWVEFTF
jgi:hypothetical protein